MKRVIIESPFAGRGDSAEQKAADNVENINYARRAVRDAVMRGEAPIASHLLFTQEGILRDENPYERKLGILCGHAWIGVAEMVVFYTDRGWSGGMRLALELLFRLRQMGQKSVRIELRALDGEPSIPDNIPVSWVGRLMDAVAEGMDERRKARL